ncbi:bifunctional nuclease family protein, partial [Candidatus Bipolaricaulota bacterium]|nr:bifunctional nuclease family protein [Candidatus Bipolaricaulota bacterium]
VAITALKEGTYYATIFLREKKGEIIELDARPSDSLALALRMGSPIYIADEVFDSSAIESPFAEEDAFQDFVEYKMDLSEFKKILK